MNGEKRVDPMYLSKLNVKSSFLLGFNRLGSLRAFGELGSRVDSSLIRLAVKEQV